MNSLLIEFSVNLLCENDHIFREYKIWNFNFYHSIRDGILLKLACYEFSFDNHN